MRISITQMNRIKQGITFAGLVFLISILTAVPAREAIARFEGATNGHWVSLFCAGLALDVQRLLVFFTLPHLLLIPLSYLWNKFHPSTTANATAKKTRLTIGSGMLGIYFVVIQFSWVFLSIAASEFRIQRGGYPLYHDVTAGVTNLDFIQNTVSIYWSQRYLPFILLAITMFLVLLPQLIKYTRANLRPLNIPYTLTFLLLSFLFFQLAFRTYLYSAKIFPGINRREENETPLDVIYRSSIAPQLRKSILSAIASWPFSPQQTKIGAALLGLPNQLPAKTASDPCLYHPLTQPLWPSNGYALPILNQLDKLSASIFNSNSPPIDIWHVIIEGFRGVDIKALNQQAIAGITPFFNQLYQQASDPKNSGGLIANEGLVLPFYHVYQSGMRTTHGLNANVCGIGTLPNNVSFGRDLGRTPFRCLPDVLYDAGFANAFHYGSDANFDQMKQFLQDHSFKIHDSLGMAQNLPRGGWGFSDLSLFNHLIKKYDAPTSPGNANYRVVLTLSNHHPYKPPQDSPLTLKTRINQLLNAHPRRLDQWERDRLFTTAYSDWAIQSFYQRLKAIKSSRPYIIILTADHTTNEKPVWQNKPSPQERLRSRIHIPLLIYFSPTFFLNQSQVQQEKQSHVLHKFIRQYAHIPISNNDIPRLILALLKHSPDLQRLPEKWRWHTLGGQVTSPYYQSPHPASSQTIWSIASDQSIVLTSDKNHHQVISSHSGQINLEHIRQQSQPLSPIYAFFSSFYQSYGFACWQPTHIRQKVPP